MNGRTDNEGRVEVKVQGQWGVICSEKWTLLEATVVCKQLGLGHARSAVQVNNPYFNKINLVFLFSKYYKTKMISDQFLWRRAITKAAIWY